MYIKPNTQVEVRPNAYAVAAKQTFEDFMLTILRDKQFNFASFEDYCELTITPEDEFSAGGWLAEHDINGLMEWLFNTGAEYDMLTRMIQGKNSPELAIKEIRRSYAAHRLDEETKDMIVTLKRESIEARREDY